MEFSLHYDSWFGHLKASILDSSVIISVAIRCVCAKDRTLLFAKPPDFHKMNSTGPFNDYFVA